MGFDFLKPGLSLVSFSAVRVIYPLARTLILARVLSGFEFGVASALSGILFNFRIDN